ncbi:MAG: universal stress protein [Rhodospirillaceae bacterium]
MFEKIIVATDGSECGNRAVATAVDIAGKYGAELVVAHVLMHGAPPESLKRMAEIEHLVDVHPDAPVAFDNMPAMAMSIAAVEHSRVEHAVIEAIGKKVAERAVQSAKDAGAAKVESVILDGEPAEKIVQAARDVDAKLIVMGCRGLSAFKRLLMGSVSQKVAQLSECACLIVR